MLKKYHSDPWVIERLSRHFYSEEVYDDSSADQPKVRWRFRNYFGDNVAHSQTTSNNEDTDLEKNNLKKTSREAPKNYVSEFAESLTLLNLTCVILENIF